MEVLKSIFCVMLEMSIVSSIIGVVTLLLNKILKNKISPKWLNIIWIVFLITLVNPFRVQSSFSIYNLLSYDNIINTEEKGIFINEALDKHTNYKSYTNSNSDVLNENSTIQSGKRQIQLISEEQVAILIDNILISSVSIYIVGILIGIIINVIANIQINNKTKKKFENERLNTILQHAKKKIKFYKNVELIKQEIITSPAVYGIFNIKIFLTEDILNMSDEEIELIFLHELLHIKNKDIYFNKFIQLLKILYWFNPVVYYLLNSVKREIELVNDENVIEQLEDDKRKLYCKTLLKVALISNNKYCSTLSIVNRASDLEDRIRMIRENEKFLKNKVLIISLVLILVLGITVCFATNKIATKTDDELCNVVINYDENSINVEKNSDIIETLNERTENNKIKNNANPIEGNLVITSTYGKRVHPLTKDEIFHNGIDIKAEQGEKVKAITTGEITYADFDFKNGNSIKIKHIDENTHEIYYSYYAHLSKINVEVGDIVDCGEKIGEVGSTGYATGPHLHLEIIDMEGNTMDPVKFIDL